MGSMSLTSHIDGATVAIYLFWLFFAGLVYYLRREDKREGYPLENDRSHLVKVQGLPGIPRPKKFLLSHEGLVEPHREERDLTGLLAPGAPFPGAPFVPLGDAMQDGVGPASYALRADKPDLTFDEALPKIVPLRAAAGYYLAEEDPDPRGYSVITADRKVAGKVVECWVDRSETLVRYLEAETESATGTRRVIFPMALAVVDGRRRTVKVVSVLAWQFAAAPAIQNPDTITLREEDRICGYFGGGHIYATPARAEPLV